MSGWVCLHRSLLDWEWYDDANTMRLFVHCLLRANFEDTNWRGIDIKRGSFVTSIATLSKELGLTIKQIRGSLGKLKRTGELAMYTTSKYSIISIPCYGEYQDKGQAKGQTKGKQKGAIGASKGQAEGKQRATDNKDNNLTNEQANKVNKGSRLSTDWVIDQQYFNEAKRLRPEFSDQQILDIAGGFKDFWISKTGANATKKDWLATWRNWIRNQKDRAQGNERRLSLSERSAIATQRAITAINNVDDVLGSNESALRLQMDKPTGRDSF